MKGVFVTGSNTGVGKTTVAIEIVRYISQTREVKVRKPVETNCELSGQNYMPKDAIALSAACQQQEDLEKVCPYCFEIAKHFDDTDIDAVEINISCPNIKEGGVAFGNDPEMSFRVVEICRKNTTKPIITKLSPNQTDIAKNAARCIDAGSDGLAVINTVTGMAVDIKTRKPVIGNNRGGLKY